MDSKFFGPITDAKLFEINKKLASEGIPHGQRPLKALSLMGYSVPLNSPEAKYVFDWFKERCRPDSFTIGSLYESVFFYDLEFWIIQIPQFYGTVRIYPLRCLKDMSEQSLALLASDETIRSEYIEHFKNSFDFGVACHDVFDNEELSKFGRGLFDGACRCLASAVAALSNKRPNFKAMEDTRQAIENFFKASGAFAENINNKRAKEIGHKLNEGLKEFSNALDLSPNITEDIKQSLKLYPNIQVRYQTANFSPQELWQGFKLAQYIGALTTRKFSNHPTIELNGI